MTIRVGLTGIDVFSQERGETQVGFTAIEVIVQEKPGVKANLAYVSVVSGVNTDPASTVSGAAVEVAITPNPVAQIAWAGLQVLTPLTDDDVPDYLDYGTISAADALPGNIVISNPLPIAGINSGKEITVYTKDVDLKLSLDGINFEDEVVVSLDDQLYLEKTITSIFSQNFRIYTFSEALEIEQEIGIWRIAGPTGTLKFDQYIYRETGNPEWVEYEQHSDDTTWQSNPAVEQTLTSAESEAPNPVFKSHIISSVDASEGEFIDSTNSIKSVIASDGEVDDSTSSIKFSNAPEGEFVDSSNSIKSSLIFGYQYELFNHYIETIQIMNTQWFGNFYNGAEYDTNDKFFKPTVDSDPTYYAGFEKMWFGFNGFYPNAAYKYGPPMIDRLIDPNYYVAQDEEIKIIDFNPVFWNLEERIIDTEFQYDVYVKMIESPEPMWVDFSEKDYIEIGTTWLKYSFAMNSFIPNNFYAHQTVFYDRLIELYPRFTQSTADYVIDTFYERYQDSPLFIPVLYSYDYALNNISLDMNYIFENQKVFESTDYIRAGGFLTPELAEDAAQAYPDNVTIVYEQPEGTFSFDVVYNNDLWCGDTPPLPVIRPIAWWMGGG